jgi:putative sigma-54 modulation protein
MRVHYKGKLARLTPASEKRLAARFARLGKLLDRGSEKEAHVILEPEKRGHRAEITVNHKNHPLVAEAVSADQVDALTVALDKLETQLVKLKAKVTDSKRRATDSIRAAEVVVEPAPVNNGPRLMRVRLRNKPMTAEEALMLMTPRQGYMAYRDAETEALCVLVRRTDGNFDLIEG